MDKIYKFLSMLSPLQRDIILRILQDIQVNNISLYDTKKLIGYSDMYRIRKGKIRIIYRRKIKEDDSSTNIVISIDYRWKAYTWL